MTAESVAALVAFALAASWTPGPNNALLAASGADFGLRRTLPHIAGVSLGFAAMVFAVAMGMMGAVFAGAPWLSDTLRWVGAAVLLWFAWRIAMASGGGRASARARPFSFVEAAVFPWVNPKARGSLHRHGSPVRSGRDRGRGHRGGVFTLAGPGSGLGWAGTGAAMQRLLSSPGRVRAFNLAMAGPVAGLLAVMATE